MDALRDSVQQALGDAYTLDRELGGGGMSRVFVAHDHALDRPVVVKALLPELACSVSVQRFAREVRSAATLQHPHVVPVLCAGHTADQIPYYLMPFVKGETLRHRLDRGAMPVGEAVDVLGDVAKALAAAHAAGLVHRDVKPDNVLLCGGAAVVTDFGIAHAMHEARVEPLHERLTTIRTSLGTPAYLAPEQAVGDVVDARADVYSFGIVAWEMLAGVHPFARAAGSSQRLIAAHIAERPASVAVLAPAAPGWLAALVMRCVEKEPAHRPADGAELLREMASRPGDHLRSSAAMRCIAGMRRLFGIA